MEILSGDSEHSHEQVIEYIDNAKKHVTFILRRAHQHFEWFDLVGDEEIQESVLRLREGIGNFRNLVNNDYSAGAKASSFSLELERQIISPATLALVSEQKYHPPLPRLGWTGRLQPVGSYFKAGVSREELLIDSEVDDVLLSMLSEVDVLRDHIRANMKQEERIYKQICSLLVIIMTILFVASLRTLILYYRARNCAEEERGNFVEALTAKKDELKSIVLLTSMAVHKMKGQLSYVTTVFRSRAPKGNRSGSTGKMDKMSEQLRDIDMTMHNLMKLFRPRKWMIEATDVAEQIEHIRNFVTPQCTEKGIVFAFYGTDPGYTALIDRTAFQEMILNVFVNAIDAMPKGGIIAVKLSTKGGSIWLEISDQGTGVDENDLEKIFQPFFTGKQDGSGIGLYVCREIAMNLGGEIKAINLSKGGACFQIILPFAKSGTYNDSGRRVLASVPAGYGSWGADK